MAFTQIMAIWTPAITLWDHLNFDNKILLERLKTNQILLLVDLALMKLVDEPSGTV